MNKQNLSKNFIYQFVYQVIILVIPLILSPYLTRVLGDTALGVYSYANSIAFYFVEIAMLGIMKYGQRLIAKSMNDEITLRKSFWSLFSLHSIVSIFSLLVYIIFVSVFVQVDKHIFIIEAIYVASALFDITWLFYGLENFRNVVIRNAIVKIVELILIFIFVKTPADLWIYTLISAAGIFIGQFVLIPKAIHVIKPIKFSFEEMLVHLKPILILTISVIAVTLYTVFDKTLLGFLTTKETVAYYEYSNKIVNIPKTFISVIGTVMFPRACKFVAMNDIENQKKYMKISLLLTTFIGMASIFGLFGIADLFVNIYYGDAFSKCANIIVALSPLVIIIGVGDIVRTQYMIPNEMDKAYILCSILNAIVNLILSITFIILLPEENKIYGAVIGTVSAELFGCTFQIIIGRGFLKISEVICYILPFSIIGLSMSTVIRIISVYMNGSFVALIIQMLVGGLVYCLLTVAYLRIFEKDIAKDMILKFRRK